MKPAISVITLGVSDMANSVRFYRDGLGLPTRASEKDQIAFFEMKGTMLALFPRHELAVDANISPAGSGFAGITLSHNVSSMKEVDDLISTIRKIGGNVVKVPQETAWGGYGSYFADPDGYLWEVVYNPKWKVDEEGLVIRNTD
ncbi:MAG: VOC family protein [Candidatus Thermoplasmatota archaeon]|jgi:catechol 2,3-dioxygenase-like lactoylglutathione lyase family enzyme|nr:VOC family protein [Candidatus Thermoplasmatota archaeon]